MAMHASLSCTLLFLGISVKWTLQEIFPPKYLHYDSATSRQLMCNQCPPGTYVKRHCSASRQTLCAPCPESHYAGEWHSTEECQYCSTVCKELQYVKQECNSTHNRLCECIKGRYLNLEFCVRHTICAPGFGAVRPGTPESNTICQRCPDGFFSNESSSQTPCRKHRNCTALGLPTASRGNASHDSVCAGDAEQTLKCGIDITLCEEAFFRFAVPTKLTPNWPQDLVDSLPGSTVDSEALERIRRGQDSQEQTFQLLKLWKLENQDQDIVKKIEQDIDRCENTVLKHIGHPNLTFDQLLVLMESLPGKRVAKEDIEKILMSCSPAEQILKLLSLWRIKNKGQDTLKGLMHGLKHLKRYHFPKAVIQSLRKTVKFLHSFTMYRLYQKLFLELVRSQVQSAKRSCL